MTEEGNHFRRNLKTVLLLSITRIPSDTRSPPILDHQLVYTGPIESTVLLSSTIHCRMQIVTTAYHAAIYCRLILIVLIELVQQQNISNQFHNRTTWSLNRQPKRYTVSLTLLLPNPRCHTNARGQTVSTITSLSCSNASRISWQQQQ